MELDHLFEDEVSARRQINFPEPLELLAMKEYFDYLSREGKFVINYEVTSDYTIGKLDFFKEPVYTPEIRGERTKKLTGRIQETTTTSFDHFETSLKYVEKEEGIDDAVFEALNFSLVPGWDLDEYRPEVIHIWDKVRELTDTYFQNRKK